MSVTAAQVLPSAIPISNLWPLRPSSTNNHSKRGTRTRSLFWPFTRNSMMFQCNSTSMPKLDMVFDEKREAGHQSVPSSPISCIRKFLDEKMNRVKQEQFSSSSCSSGYSSGYSSGDSAAAESDYYSSSVREVSATDIGSSGFKLQMKMKRRNSKENLKANYSSSSFLNDAVDSHSEFNQNSVTTPPTILSASEISNVSICTDNVSSSDNSIDLPTPQPIDRQTLSDRSSKSSVSSTTSSEISNEGSIRRRVKDDEGYIRRAACVCVNDDESKVVLISSKNDGGGWLVPGGGLEAGEEPCEAAVREAWEEAGITGSIQRCLGTFQLEDAETRKRKRTTVYVLKVQEQHNSFPESSLGRVRQWYSIEAASNHLSKCKPHQIAYLRAL